MDLKKRFASDLRSKEYDPRIEVVRRAGPDFSGLGKDAWVLLLSCKKFILYLEAHLSPEHSKVKGASSGRPGLTPGKYFYMSELEKLRVEEQSEEFIVEFKKKCGLTPEFPLCARRSDSGSRPWATFPGNTSKTFGNC